MYVIVARWQGKQGSGDEIASQLQQMIIQVKDEPGCVMYECNRDPENPDKFMLYEQYLDESAFQDHLATTPFKEIVLGKIVPLLIDRKRETWQTIEP